MPHEAPKRVYESVNDMCLHHLRLCVSFLCISKLYAQLRVFHLCMCVFPGEAEAGDHSEFMCGV